MYEIHCSFDSSRHDRGESETIFFNLRKIGVVKKMKSGSCVPILVGSAIGVIIYCIFSECEDQNCVFSEYDPNVTDISGMVYKKS